MATEKIHQSVTSDLVFRKDIFNGKVLFCTGGGSGICNRQVEAMMRRKFTLPGYIYQWHFLNAIDGAKAAIVGRRKANIAEAAEALSKVTGRECFGVAGDVRKVEEIQSAVAQTIEKFGMSAPNECEDE